MIQPIKSLIVDNYDSFTFNLYQIVAEINGTLPVVVRNDRDSWNSLRNAGFDNIIISPGPGCPSKESDFGICRQVILESNIPLLGICLGHQGLGYWYGGIVKPAPEAMHGRLSQIYHNESDLFAGIPSPFSVVRYHSLILEEPLPTSLQRIAWTKEGLLMGLRHISKPHWGVQFHPESICTDYGMHILANFRDLTIKFWSKKSDHRLNASKYRDIRSIVPAGHKSRQKLSSYEVKFRKLDFFREPENVFLGIYASSSISFWLDSSLVKKNLSRFSFMGDSRGSNSFLAHYKIEKNELTILSNKTYITTKKEEDFFNFLDRELKQRYCRLTELPFDFNCGFVGYFGYEMKAQCGSQRVHNSSLPDATFLFADRLIAFDHQESTIYLVCLTENSSEDSSQDAENWFDNIEKKLINISSLSEINLNNSRKKVTFQLSRWREKYIKDIEYCFNKINNGESYEVCLTNHLRTDYRPNPLNLHRLLRQQNPAPYAAYLRFEDIHIVSSSPERFLKIDRDKNVESKPIKGTYKRGKTVQEDEHFKEFLRNNEKDRAENLMIVDLLRNDLGKVCEVGTVTVPKLMDIETYSTVHQMVSTVRGRLRPEISSTDCVRASFPGGSMTGAPKLRTMEIIDGLEREARGVYSGSIGFMALSGAADLNIVIRTVVISPHETTLGIGGAIVSLSEAEAEFDEILLKAYAPLKAILQTKNISINSSEQQAKSLLRNLGKGYCKHSDLRHQLQLWNPHCLVESVKNGLLIRTDLR